jgi:hypothetical protein
MDSAGADPDTLWQEGIRLFNAGEYFACHEVWEDLWNQQSGDEKQLTQGLIQLAVATCHLQRENRVGAEKLYRRAIARLQPFSPSARGIDIAQLLADAQNSLNHTSGKASQGARSGISIKLVRRGSDLT